MHKEFLSVYVDVTVYDQGYCDWFVVEPVGGEVFDLIDSGTSPTQGDAFTVALRKARYALRRQAADIERSSSSF